jgi:tRNA(Ile)-lysidine synthase TilS/MesJ
MRLIFLFSAGQDSLYYLYFFLSQKKKDELALLTVNHQEQLNSQLLDFHIIRFGLILNQRVLNTVFPNFQKFDFLQNEKNFRFGRYTLSKRISICYKNSILLSGHTKSDLIETLFLHFFQNLKTSNFLFFGFDKKQFLKKTFFSSFTKSSKLKKQKKVNKDFKISFFIKKKQPIILERPLHNIQRLTSLFIFKTRFVPFFVELTNFNNFILRNKIRSYFFPFFELFKNNSDR